MIGGRFTTPDPASDPGWNLQLYGLGDPLNLYDPEGLGVVSTLVRLFGDEQINQFSDADLDAAYGNDKDVLMGMSYGARNAITLGFYADYESPDEFAKRNGCKADTAAFAAASIATEFACDFALSAATGGAAGAIKGGLKVAQTTRRIAKAWQAAQWTSDAIHAAKGVATYAQTGDATQLLGAAGMAGSHGLGRIFSSRGRSRTTATRVVGQTGEMCFVAGTLVCTVDGYKSIESICVGEKVLSKNEATGELGFKEVLTLFRTNPNQLVHLTYVPKDTCEGAETAAELIGTPVHPIWSVTRSAWIEMGQLEVGEELLLADGRCAKVVETWVEHAPTGTSASGPFTTYNFEVADWHTYFVTPSTLLPPVWVHNTGRICPEGKELLRLLKKQGLSRDERRSIWRDLVGYENLDADKLSAELADAARRGIKPVRLVDEALEQLVARHGQLKYVVTLDGTVLVGPTKVKHSVLAGGANVRAAGTVQMTIDPANGRLVAFALDNESGHYRPDPESLMRARQAFERSGVNFLD